MEEVSMTTHSVPQRSDADFIQSASVTSMMRALLTDKNKPMNNPDYLAKHFVSEPWNNFLLNPEASLEQIEKRLPGGVYYLLLRTRYFDQSLQNWINRFPQSQIVSLGAGFDTRSIRFNQSDNTLFFYDVDLKAMLDYKKNIIKGNKLTEKSNIHYVPTNFQTDDVFKNLESQGFNPSLPTYFFCEGVSFFLEEENFQTILDGITQLDNKHNILAFDYAFKDYIDGDLHFHGAKETYEELKNIGEPHVFGINYNDVTDYFKEKGFRSLNNYSASMLDLLYFGDIYGNASPKRSTSFFGLTEIELL